MDADEVFAGPIRLPAVLDLNAAAPLTAEILSRRGGALEIDASAVHRLGGQCLQVLLSAIALWRADEASVSLRDPSERFCADWTLFGADALHPTSSLEPLS